MTKNKPTESPGMTQLRARAKSLQAVELYLDAKDEERVLWARRARELET